MQRGMRLPHAVQHPYFRCLQDPTYNISIENHEFGLPVEHYEKWPVLKDHYKILTTAKDRYRAPLCCAGGVRMWSGIMPLLCSP